MQKRKSMDLWICALVLAGSLTAPAQQPRVVNAKTHTQSAAAGLERDFRALVGGVAGPAWVGYAVPVVAGRRHMCCYDHDHCCGGCALEGRSASAGSSQRAAPTGPVQLETAGYLLVLFRIEQGKVQKIRTFSDDCELDAGGLPFSWLTGVRPSESINLLAPYARGADAGVPAGERRDAERLADAALAAIALHADPAADRLLEEFVAAQQPETLRKRSAFWLGAARGRRGYELLNRLVREDASDKVRERAVFALSVSKEPEAVDAILRVARNDGSSHVRGQALFWLAQKAGKKAAEAITEAIENDPETEVKRRAVFALSQLPKDEGVPLLIQVARTNKNTAVRKQAMFWLGQSKDPRALTFFEELLTRR